MEQGRDSLLAALPSVAKGPKLRRKLQKSVSKHRSNIAWRFGSGASTESPSSNKCDTANNKPATQAQNQGPPLPSPDLSDPKWAEFFRGDLCTHAQEMTSRSWEHLGITTHIVPELSHLATTNSQPPPTSASDAPASSTPKMRRRAKTPIFSIGQLEDITRPSNALARTSSVELIADQYRALLDYRASVYTDSYSEPPPSLEDDDEGDDDDHEGAAAMRRQRSSESLPDDAPICVPMHLGELVQRSPTSDDGTLVSFEEETVYFKPVSFSPEPTSPAVQVPSNPSHSPPDDNLSLQICLDLLTRDLSSALASRPSRSCAGTSALQVWVMIEAYEKLRDRILESGNGSEESRSLGMMFDMWLRALYTIHDSLNGSQAASESDYGAELGTEELD
ncbi:Mating-type switching protein swi10 [Madurella fahalii]|uniref:Mating-type switching protein swi10 n=1 Tax=Madurella fahalii TaxID=1157608 RepID=A0ABQ0GE29_9PEZI